MPWIGKPNSNEVACYKCSDCGDPAGCFSPDTQMLMSDFSLKRANDIRPGDLLWNPLRWRSFAVKTAIAGPDPARLLRAGDTVMGQDMKFHRVTASVLKN